MSRELIDLTGQRFGKLVVIERKGSLDGQPLWKCKCDCGREKLVVGYALRGGNTKSCGCINKERFAALSKTFPQKTHGMSNEKLYKRWVVIKQNCNSPTSSGWFYYGAKGIKMCPEWENDYAAFKKWSMENGCQEGYWLIRIDKDGPYSPENCKWIDKKEVGYHGKEIQRT